MSRRARSAGTGHTACPVCKCECKGGLAASIIDAVVVGAIGAVAATVVGRVWNRLFPEDARAEQ